MMVNWEYGVFCCYRGQQVYVLMLITLVTAHMFCCHPLLVPAELKHYILELRIIRRTIVDIWIKMKSWAEYTVRGVCSRRQDLPCLIVIFPGIGYGIVVVIGRILFEGKVSVSEDVADLDLLKDFERSVSALGASTLPASDFPFPKKKYSVWRLKV